MIYRLRGDTIIEVVMGIALFSLVAISTLAIMNKGLAISQRSLETTLVRQQLDTQAEMLRFVHAQSVSGEDDYDTLWTNILAKKVDSPKSIIGADSCPDGLTNAFFLYPSTAMIRLGSGYGPASVYAEVQGGESQGISIQLTRPAGERAYDAHIQACWDSPGGSQPMTIGTIVRLYDPR